MKKFLKWAGIVIGVLLVCGFIAFLYLIPPFTLVPPEEFSKPEAAAAPSLDDIKDPAIRLVAERGKTIVTNTGCAGCHTPQGEKGPNFDHKYMAGGMKFVGKGHGTFFTRNLTPDPNTGLARWSDEEVTRILSSGVNMYGRVINTRMMPWGQFANWTAEDRYAVITYLRHLKPIHNEVPEQILTEPVIADPKAVEAYYGDDASHN